ncbi:MAG: MFS transporter [Syntrophobacteraceae bacterium CG23_combo_of_CG06-09_8_20_14_all_50_8]|nr:MAG: MFS transporter [Syntrophobacteraceae bacterium CG23_combo_of_CG06-09_8_20_14_all_50_8]
MKLEKNSFPPSSGIKLTFRTLRYRNYRLFFIGNGISMTGNWMQQVAMSWLVYRLTNSSLLLGVIAFAGLFPGFLLTPLAGVLSDRWSRRHILLVSQVLAMLQAIAMTFLVMTGMVAVWHIMFLSVLLGLISAFDITARQSFIVDTIEEREDLGSAIALNSALFNGARLLGPSLAGITIAATGEGICFLINTLSYLAFIATLFLMKIKSVPTVGNKASIVQGFKDGFMFTLNFLPIRCVLLLLALVNLIGMPYAVLMPVFAKDILHGGPHTFGFLTAASGAGALTGALYLASRRIVLGAVKIIPVATCIFGLGLIFFSLSKVLWVSLFLLLLTGFGMMVQLALSNTIIQTLVDDDMRGRVMSFFTMAFMGTIPFGSLLAGGFADLIGAPRTLIIGGLCCILGALAYASKLPLLRDMVRLVYVRKGIISA